jgi:hypothetical protein
MSFNFMMMVIFLLIPIIIYSDYKSVGSIKNQNSEFLLAVTPLLVFFYPAQFFYTLSLLMLLVLYGTALKIVAHKYQWVKFDLQLMKDYSIGSFGLALLGYGLYKLVAYMRSLFESIEFSSLATSDVWLNKINTVIASLNHWSYLTYVALIIVILLATIFDRVPKRQGKEELSLFLVLFIFPASLMLPWYSDHYWWFLLTTLIFMPLVVFFVYGYKEDDKQEAKDIARLFTYVYFGLSHLNVFFYWLLS